MKVNKKTLSNVSERKNVTVLFSDMSGYTAITERLDPEEVKDLIVLNCNGDLDSKALGVWVFLSLNVLPVFGVVKHGFNRAWAKFVCHILDHIQMLVVNGME